MAHTRSIAIRPKGFDRILNRIVLIEELPKMNPVENLRQTLTESDNLHSIRRCHIRR